MFALAGTWRDPWLWGYAIVWSTATFYALFTIDEDLARERFHPPVAGADRVALHFIRLMAISHLVVGALDSGRWHLTGPVPPTVRAVALVAHGNHVRAVLRRDARQPVLLNGGARSRAIAVIASSTAVSTPSCVTRDMPG